MKLSVLFFFCVATAFGSDASTSKSIRLRSAARHGSETFKQAVRRHLETLKQLKPQLYFSDAETVFRAARPLKDLDFSKVPNWKDEATLAKAFLRIRDERFLQDPNRPDFPRRSTWLYPQDGCWARAALAGRRAEQWGLPKPAKVFIFGPLVAKTRNVPGGEVEWWYHVAPLVSLSGKQNFVLDPALEPRNPIVFQDWVARLSAKTQSVRVSICNPHAFAPDSPCENATPDAEKSALFDQLSFLDPERQNLIELKRDPERELGNEPVWERTKPGAEGAAY